MYIYGRFRHVKNESCTPCPPPPLHTPFSWPPHPPVDPILAGKQMLGHPIIPQRMYQGEGSCCIGCDEVGGGGGGGGRGTLPIIFSAYCACCSSVQSGCTSRAAWLPMVIRATDAEIMPKLDLTPWALLRSHSPARGMPALLISLLRASCVAAAREYTYLGNEHCGLSGMKGGDSTGDRTSGVHGSGKRRAFLVGHPRQTCH